MRREGQRECGSFLISLPAQLAEKMVAFILYLGYSTRQKRPDLFDSAQDVQIASRVAVDVTAPTFNARELGDRGGGGVIIFVCFKTVCTLYICICTDRRERTVYLLNIISCKHSLLH